MASDIFVEHLSRRITMRSALNYLYDEASAPFALEAYININEIYSSLEDPNAHDGEWHMIVTLPHEVAEHEGYGVPVFEGDVERREWEQQRGLRV